MTIEIWGKVVDSTIPGYKGKGKERAHDAEDTGMGRQGDEWKVLEHWDVNLNDLIPLPDDVRIFNGISFLANLPLVVDISSLSNTFQHTMRDFGPTKPNFLSSLHTIRVGRAFSISFSIPNSGI